MANSYRIYTLNALGRIMRGDWFDADDDEAARQDVHRFCAPGTAVVELWCERRLVGRFPCAPDNCS